MSRNRKIPFAKYHAVGNDFIVVGARGLPGDTPALAQAICERHTGVGADGLLVVSPPRAKTHTARLRIFNSDGSEAEMSGNGIRCAAAFLAEGLRARSLRMETAAGVKPLRLLERRGGKWKFRVGMGAPILEPARVPFRGGPARSPAVSVPLRAGRGVFPVTVTSLGNPHCTVLVKDFAAVDWRRLGREIERHRWFPRRTNVEFVKVISRRQIEVRFWERGAGETLSSGTGSCAAVVACILNGRTGRRVSVRTPAGRLEVEWSERGELRLVGPVERTARGVYFYRG